MLMITIMLIMLMGSECRGARTHMEDTDTHGLILKHKHKDKLAQGKHKGSIRGNDLNRTSFRDRFHTPERQTHVERASISHGQSAGSKGYARKIISRK